MTGTDHEEYRPRFHDFEIDARGPGDDARADPGLGNVHGLGGVARECAGSVSGDEVIERGVPERTCALAAGFDEQAAARFESTWAGLQYGGKDHRLAPFGGIEESLGHFQHIGAIIRAACIGCQRRLLHFSMPGGRARRLASNSGRLLRVPRHEVEEAERKYKEVMKAKRQDRTG